MTELRISTRSQKCEVNIGRKTSLTHPKLFENLSVGYKGDAEYMVVNHMI